MILSDMESLRRKLDFLLLMHTEGSGKLNISMQLVVLRPANRIVENFFLECLECRPTHHNYTTYYWSVIVSIDLSCTIF